jgi:hypothetical protein
MGSRFTYHQSEAELSQVVMLEWLEICDERVRKGVRGGCLIGSMISAAAVGQPKPQALAQQLPVSGPTMAMPISMPTSS